MPSIIIYWGFPKLNQTAKTNFTHQPTCKLSSYRVTSLKKPVPKTTKICLPQSITHCFLLSNPLPQDTPQDLSPNIVETTQTPSQLSLPLAHSPAKTRIPLFLTDQMAQITAKQTTWLPLVSMIVSRTTPETAETSSTNIIITYCHNPPPLNTSSTLDMTDHIHEQMAYIFHHM